MAEPQYLQCCSANYIRLMRLLNNTRAVGDTFRWSFTKGAFVLHIKAQQPYTEFIEIQHDIPTNVRWITSFTMELCLYHDVRLAEIMNIHWQQKPAMNHLLCEALAVCNSISTLTDR